MDGEKQDSEDNKTSLKRKEDEMKQRWFFIALLVAAVITFTAGAGLAGQVRNGIFQVEVYNSEVPDGVGWDRAQNDGFMSSWFRYTPPPTTTQQNWQFWWNEWWYNDPFVRDAGKWIKLGFTWAPINPNQPVDFHVIINWTNGGWIGQNGPPIPFGQPGGNTDDPERYIVRDNPYNAIWNPGDPLPQPYVSPVYWILPYNPEWVSVDVRGANFMITGGWIQHQCVPLPAALWLLGPGLVGLGIIRRRFWK